MYKNAYVSKPNWRRIRRAIAVWAELCSLHVISRQWHTVYLFMAGFYLESNACVWSSACYSEVTLYVLHITTSTIRICFQPLYYSIVLFTPLWKKRSLYPFRGCSHHEVVYLNTASRFLFLQWSNAAHTKLVRQWSRSDLSNRPTKL